MFPHVDHVARRSRKKGGEWDEEERKDVPPEVKTERHRTLLEMPTSVVGQHSGRLGGDGDKGLAEIGISLLDGSEGHTQRDARERERERGRVSKHFWSTRERRRGRLRHDRSGINRVALMIDNNQTGINDEFGALVAG